MRRRFFTTKGNKQYLTMEVLESGSMELGERTDNIIYYRINKGYWTTLIYAKKVTVEKGQIIEFKCLYEAISTSGIGDIVTTFKCKLSGNCLSLIFGDDFQDKDDISAYPYAFNYLFTNCDVTEVSRDFLPATTLASNCYREMFRGCTCLTTAPELPATTLANECYDSMFKGCTSLTTAPELPATTLASYCYYDMFYNCKKLNYIKMLATDISAHYCLLNWVKGVASTGTFVKNPDMTSLPTATASNSYVGIPSGWTVVNDGEE